MAHRSRRCKPRDGERLVRSVRMAIAVRAGLPAGNRPASATADLRRSTLLLMSRDVGFYERLRQAANRLGRWVVRAAGTPSAIPSLQVLRPAAVLLDLDPPAQRAWQTAEELLEHPGCPPLLFLTSCREQFDLRTALRAGALVDKAEEPDRLLQMADETARLSESNQAERTALQRVLIRWLKPCRWSAPVTGAHRFWGIPE